MLFLFRNKKVSRVFASTLSLVVFTQVFAPAAAWALTAGPTSPEFSSFEPVDTRDMVNLQTGDFTYNIPLLEVPGPEGGYPLALSYHAGINPDEEASWVGLGWSLNPGAINRTVNFFPDDISGASRTVTDHWNGGERSTYSFGVGICGIGIDVAVANDTYKGQAVGMGGGVSYYYGFEKFGIGAGIGISPDPYGESDNNLHMSAGVSFSGKASGNADAMTSGVGIATNFESVSVYAGLGTSYAGGKYSQGNSLLGASLSSNGKDGIHASGSIGGTSYSQNNSSAGKVSTSGNSFGITIPIYFVTISLGSSYVRYWSDERDQVSTYGSLHANIASTNFNGGTSFDSYPLIDLTRSENRVLEPEHQAGGSFPAYDNYAVMAQGVGGYMQPYLFEQGSLYRQNIADNPDNNNIKQITYQNETPFTKKAQFRFKGEFSNSKEKLNNTEGYNNATNHLAGKTHVAWFTNQEVASGAARLAGFQDVVRQTTVTFGHESYTYIGGVRAWGHGKYTYNIANQAGGFMITNSTGVTYHYALPAYSYDEVQKFTSKDHADVDSYRILENPQPYAYTWLLTAVTGPDYVDRGDVGLDDDDYGYWVKLNYGKWTDEYKWRTPFNGTKTDIDTKVKSYAYGRKEIYYLDAIETRSHVALFVKDVRKDGLSVGNPNTGSIAPESNSDVYYDEFPSMSLKLNQIKLYKKGDLIDNNDNINSIKQSGDPSLQNYKFDYSWETFRAGRGTHTTQIIHHPENVIMQDDIAVNSAFDTQVLRQIDFGTSYKLCNNTPNSVDNISQLYKVTPDANILKTGKLTLTKLTYLGKGGTPNIPSMLFDYGTNNPDYNRDNVDMWGNYKNVNTELLKVNENAAKMVTDAGLVDAWSLKQITTSLGAKIHIAYESDEYNNVELAKQTLFSINKVVNLGNNKVKVYLNNPAKVNISDYFSGIGGYFGMSIVEAYSKYTTGVDFTPNCPSGSYIGSYSHINPDIKFFTKKLTGIPISSVNDTESYIEFIHSYTYHDIVANGKEYSGDPVKIWWQPIGDDPGGYIYCPVTYDYDRWPSYIAAGVVFTPVNPTKGGGLRVASISLQTNNISNITKYTYANGTTSYEPFIINKAVKTSEPSLASSYAAEAVKLLDQHIGKLYNSVLFNAREIPGPGVFYGNTTVTEYVKHSNNAEKQLPGRKEYVFDPLFVPDYDKGEDTKKTMYGYSQRDLEVDGSVEQGAYMNGRIGYTDALTKSNHKEIKIRDFTNRAGILKNVIDYDINNKPVSQTQYTYLHDLYDNNSDIRNNLSSRFMNQGVVHQTFKEKRDVEGIGMQTSISHKYDYPVVLLKTTTTNFTTGLSSETENLAFDFFTGAVTKLLTKDSYGNAFVTETTPAYHVSYKNSSEVSIYPYSGMGLKVNNILNKNMLEQEAMSVTYKVNPAFYKVDTQFEFGKLGLVAASVTTWNTGVGIPVLNITAADQIEQNKIWRKHKNYTWLAKSGDVLNTDGTHKLPDYTAYNFDPAQTLDARWLKTAEVKLVDAYSHALEVTDVNGRYAATRMDNESKKVLATASNAKYSEFAYSGMESQLISTSEGGVNTGNGTPSIAFNHTGKFSLAVPPNQKGFNVVLSSPAGVARKYRASVWVYLPNSNDINLVGITSSDDVTVKPLSNGVESKKAGAWYLISRIISPTAGSTANITIACKNNSGQTVYFDDFRLQPLVSDMTSYVYDNKTDELTYVIDNDNLYTRFVYNSDGKLERTYKERLQHAAGESLLSESKLNYKK